LEDSLFLFEYLILCLFNSLSFALALAQARGAYFS